MRGWFKISLTSAGARRTAAPTWAAVVRWPARCLATLSCSHFEERRPPVRSCKRVGRVPDVELTDLMG